MSKKVAINDTLGKLQCKGRRPIIIDTPITKENVKDILQEALKIHNVNRSDMQYLIDYYNGEQDIRNRVNPYTSNVNNKITLNYANSSIRTITGYFLGIPIKITQKSTEFQDDVQKISNYYDYEDVRTVDMEAATFASITGLGYECTLPSSDFIIDENPEIPIRVVSLDPRFAFCIQTNEIGNPTVASCSFYESNDVKKYTLFVDNQSKTDTTKFVVTLKDNDFDGATVEEVEFTTGINPISMIKNNLFNTGDFEIAIDVLNAINQIASDSVNDVENTIKALLVIINSEFDDNTKIEQIKRNRVMTLVGKTGANTVDAKFINQQLDAIGVQNIRTYLEEAYKVIMGIPDRQSRNNGGGDTGKAVELRNGYEDLEILSRIKEMYFYKAKKKQLAVALKILKKAGYISEKLSIIDIDATFARNRGDNILTKSQAVATLKATNIFADVDILTTVGIGTNPIEMVENGKKQKQNDAELSEVTTTEEIVVDKVNN